MIIGGLQKFSLIDYPGEVCAIIFTKGCNFRCPYCHNPELVASGGQTIDVEYVFSFLKNRVGRLSGVSITGGEPTLHSDLIDFIKTVRLMGYEKIKLDTNGTNPDMLNELIKNGLVTYIAMDIKAPFDRYEDVTNVKCDIDKIKRSVDIIKNGKIDYEFRTTVVEGLLKVDDVFSIAEHIKGSRAYYIQRFVPSKTLNRNFENRRSFLEEELKNIEKTVGSMFEMFAVR